MAATRSRSRSTALARLAALAVLAVLMGVGLVPGAEAAAPRPFVAQPLVARSGAAFVPAGGANPINARGLVAGSTSVGGVDRAAVFNLKTRKLRVLPAFPGQATYAVDINNVREVAGEVRGPLGASQAFSWSLRTGKVTTLKSPGASITSASAINARGVVVGSATSATSTYAVVWKVRKKRQLTIPGMQDAVGINNRGWVIGTRIDTSPEIENHALIWNPTTRKLRDLKPLSDDDGAQPTSINKHGVVVGTSYSVSRDDLVLRPVLWRRPAATPCRLSESVGTNWASAVNDRGQVVGAEIDFADEHTRAVLWNACGRPSRTLSESPEGSYAVATGINNRGQIVGTIGPLGVQWKRSPRS